jgi:hypothetical protein
MATIDVKLASAIKEPPRFAYLGGSVIRVASRRNCIIASLLRFVNPSLAQQAYRPRMGLIFARPCDRASRIADEAIMGIARRPVRAAGRERTADKRAALRCDATVTHARREELTPLTRAAERRGVFRLTTCSLPSEISERTGGRSSCVLRYPY